MVEKPNIHFTDMMDISAVSNTNCTVLQNLQHLWDFSDLKTTHFKGGLLLWPA